MRDRGESPIHDIRILRARTPTRSPLTRTRSVQLLCERGGGGG
eukprot:SAG31_NODE_19383_length_604_cov_0.740594_1_plen_42_part_01